jgi:hypothetical protein
LKSLYPFGGQVTLTETQSGVVYPTDTASSGGVSVDPPPEMAGPPRRRERRPPRDGPNAAAHGRGRFDERDDLVLASAAHLGHGEWPKRHRVFAVVSDHQPGVTHEYVVGLSALLHEAGVALAVVGQRAAERCAHEPENNCFLIVEWGHGRGSVRPSRRSRRRDGEGTPARQSGARARWRARDRRWCTHSRSPLRRAEEIFVAASSGGRTLHQIGQSRLTHLAEAGENAAMLRAKSRRRSLGSLERYTCLLQPRRRSAHRPPRPQSPSAITAVAHRIIEWTRQRRAGVIHEAFAVGAPARCARTRRS